MELSVVIPACNEEKYIEKTLDAINSAKAEIIVVCNGCTDNTFDVVSKYAKTTGKPVKVFNLKQRGVSMARNFGAKMAKGKKIVFLDADIILGADVLEKIASSKFTIGTCKAKANTNSLFPKSLMALKTLTHYVGACTGLIFCTREIFKRIGGFDESMMIGEDGKFLRAAKKIGKYGVVDAYVYNNMRRFEQEGYAKLAIFWLGRIFDRSQKGYKMIR